jgi:sec-independent protein translocase protein TatB
MFDLAWSELAMIGLVAVLVLGPKELPGAMRTVAKMLRKMRSLTSELQGHMNEIVREAELEDVRNSIQKLSTTNLKAEVAKLADPTGELTSALNQPMLPPDATPSAPTTPELLPDMHAPPESATPAPETAKAEPPAGTPASSGASAS